MIKTLLCIIFFMLFVSCSVYDNPVDPDSDKYQGYETVSSINDIKPVVSSSNTGKAILISTKSTNASSYEFQIGTGDIITSETNVLDISDTVIDNAETINWRVRGRSSDKVGLWSDYVTKKTEASITNAFTNKNQLISNSIILRRSNLAWGDSWEVKHSSGSEASVIKVLDDDYKIINMSNQDLYSIREVKGDVKGFWTKDITISINPEPYTLNNILEDDKTYLIGSKNSDFDTPDTDITVKKEFLMGKYEVSNKVFCNVVNSQLANSEFKLVIKEDGLYNGDKLIAELLNNLIKSGEALTWATNRENRPVSGLTWYGAILFAELINNHEGWGKVTNIDDYTVDSSSTGYRLPYEAEWELIARGDNDYTYPFGNTFDETKLNSNSTGSEDVTLNSSMAGNVWEWCLDKYSSDEYSSNKNTNYRVIRGGSWKESEAALFNNSHRGYRSYDYADECVGLRLVFQVGR